MEPITIMNLSTGHTLARRGLLSNSFMDRLRGLMGKKALNRDEGLCIKPCNSIHMFFMKFAIDAVFVDKDNQVCLLVPGLKPWSVIPFVRGASYVLELPEGSIQEKSISLRDEIAIRKETAPIK